MNRILVIRGGAIGDFILTLPALKALRDAHRRSHIEILGYAHIAAIADKRFYADAVRSIEYGPLSRFFARGALLPRDLCEYFAGFDLIVSYLFDPDAIFRHNLKRAGAQKIVTGPAKLIGGSHAARQLARPMVSELGLPLLTTDARFYPSEDDRSAAKDWGHERLPPIIVFHPGSGSEKKNWPLRNWIELGDTFLRSPEFNGSLFVVTGEADTVQADALLSVWKGSTVQFLANLPLPHLAGLLERAIFVGHDSGISHLAAAAGAKCILLFGPTDAKVWAPTGENVEIILAGNGRLESIALSQVADAVRERVRRAQE